MLNHHVILVCTKGANAREVNELAPAKAQLPILAAHVPSAETRF
jgi:hypothetical protein